MANHETPTTGNGWPVLEPNSGRLTTWTVPGAKRRLTTRDDVLGFLIVWLATFWNDLVERLDGPGADLVDEGSYAYRPIRGSSAPSEHSAAAAVDLNWGKHPQGVPIARTFTAKQIKTIRRKVRQLNLMAGGVTVQWGGEWPSHPGSTAKTDGMHLQVVHGRVTRLVKILVRLPRGKRVLAANPWFEVK